MYPAPFGLNRRPFSSTPDPTCVVPVGGMPEAISELEHCAQDGQGIGILTAPAGLGKTILCRKLAEELREQFAVVFLPNANFPTRRSLLQAVLYEMGHPYLRLGEQELRLEFNAAVRDLCPDRAGLVLIIDEAHLLHNRLLEELRTATHLLHDGEMLVRLILSGQLELEERLVKKDLAAINQRIVCHSTLCSLSMAESEEYLQQRIEWAGGNLTEIFEPAAVRLICQASDGNPRCLNQLSDHGLLLASAGNESRVNSTHVLKALEELKQLPLHWNDVEISRPQSPTASRAVEFVRSSEVEVESDEESQTASFEWGADEETESIKATPQSTQSAEPAKSLREALPAEAELEITWDDLEAESSFILESEVQMAMEPQGAEAEPSDEVLLAKSPATTPTSCEADLWATVQPIAFEEERIIDPAALLDQGLVPQSVPRPPRNWVTWDPEQELRAEEDAFAAAPPSSQWPDFTIIDPLPEPGEEWQPEDIRPGRRKPIAHDPSELIDRILPLIDAALSEDCLELELDETLTNIVADSTRMPEPAVEPLFDATRPGGVMEYLASWPLQPELGKSNGYYYLSHLEANLEDRIAQTVLDTHADIQPLMWNSTTASETETKPEPPPRVAHEEPIRDPGDSLPFEELRDSLEQALDAVGPEAPSAKAKPLNVEYDIVMPEPDDEPISNDPQTRTDAPATGQPENHAIRRSYQNLFSQLRHKKTS